jgi:hypothetical protein
MRAQLAASAARPAAAVANGSWIPLQATSIGTVGETGLLVIPANAAASAPTPIFLNNRAANHRRNSVLVLMGKVPGARPAQLTEHHAEEIDRDVGEVARAPPFDPGGVSRGVRLDTCVRSMHDRERAI